MRAFGRILLISWAIMLADLFLSGFSPSYVDKVLRPEFVRFALLPLLPLSFFYGVVWVYRQGMRSAGRKQDSRPPK